MAARPRAPEEAPARPLPELASARRRRRGKREVAGAGRRRAAGTRTRARASQTQPAPRLGKGPRERGEGEGARRRRCRDQWEARAPAPVGTPGAWRTVPTRLRPGRPFAGAGPQRSPPGLCASPGGRRGLRASSRAPRAPHGAGELPALGYCRGGGSDPWDKSEQPGRSPPQDPDHRPGSRGQGGEVAGCQSLFFSRLFFHPCSIYTACLELVGFLVCSAGQQYVQQPFTAYLLSLAQCQKLHLIFSSLTSKVSVITFSLQVKKLRR